MLIAGESSSSAIAIVVRLRLVRTPFRRGLAGITVPPVSSLISIVYYIYDLDRNVYLGHKY